MKSFLIFLSLSILASGLYAQFANILLDDQVKAYNPCEPSITFNYKNPQNIVAGAILDKVYQSQDGGKTWSQSRLKSPYGVYGDPCLVSDKKGNIYYFHLANPKNEDRPDSWLDRIVCQVSKDNGKTWSEGSYMGYHPPKDQDKEWAVAHPHKIRIYCTWTQFDLYGSKDEENKSNILFASTKNKGKTWSEAVQINQIPGDCIDDDGTVEGAVPCVGPKGEIYVSWSLDEKIYFDRSMDGGKTWMEEDVIVSDQPGGWAIDIPGLNRSNGMPITGVDISKGPRRGTVYVNWADQRNGSEDTDIWLARSTDQGLNWSAPIRVNDDSSGRHQFLTWMSIDPQTGYLYFVFYDRRNHEDDHTDVFLAYSRDGGNTFTNIKISESPFLPTPHTFFGDYNDIDAYKGVVCPIWTRMDEGQTSVYTSVIQAADLE